MKHCYIVKGLRGAEEVDEKEERKMESENEREVRKEELGLKDP